MNHREVSATESRGFVRYAYASVAGGGETLSVYNDSTATWAKGPPPALPDKKGRGTIIASRASLPLAIVFPGAGQLAGSSKKKGVLYSLAGIAGASLVVMGVTGTKSAAKAGTIATTNEEFTAAMKNHETRERFAMAGGGAFGIAWLVGVIDAAMHRGEGGTSVSLISGPRSSRVANGAHSLGIRIPLGGNPR